MRLVVRGLVTLLSVAVLGVSAFGWVSLRALNRSTPTAQVIAGPQTSPTAEQNILLVGVDSRTDAQGDPLPGPLLDALHAGSGSDGGDTADTLIVVHVPAGGGRATVVSIPRDSYVQLADGLGKHKINSAYARAAHSTTEALTEPAGAGSTSPGAGYPDAGPAAPSPDDPAVHRAADAAGARATIGTVEALTGLSITHYASVNLAGFADVSQAIGGVPVCLRAPVDDDYSGLRLPAGPQVVSGAQALAFVRQRHGLPNGDLDRITRQQVFLAGAVDRILSSGVLADPFALRALSGVVGRSVTLDAGWDVLGFARQAEGLSADAVTFRTIPTGDPVMQTPSDGEAVQVDPDQVRSFVATAIAQDDPARRALRSSSAGAPSNAAVTRAAQVSGPTPPAPPTAPASPAAPGAPAPSAPVPAGAPVPAPSPAPAPITAAAPGCIN